jgi:hypothetical protein
MKTVGIAEAKFEVPDNIDADNEEIRRMFEGGPVFPSEHLPGEER